MAPVALPIDSLLPELCHTLARSSSLVLEAPPGAGKTTRVPSALLEARIGEGKEIVVLQPRRLPTRLAAQRVAEERGETLGRRVGYQVRFEEVGSAETRLRFVTEGILGRRLLSEPTLPNVGVVVLDEFHERHLASDIALAQLRRLQETARPDLKLLVMSATLEAEPVARYLGGAPRLRSEGRRFEVTTEYLEAPDDRYLDQQVLSALKRAVTAGRDGDVLVFLPGAGEIRRALETCAPWAEGQGMVLLPLHGDLPPAEQDRAVRPGRQRKIILSTNVAETSVTIDGVGLVIDSGLARVASHSPWSGLPVLKVAKTSRASAIQRAGRAGRTRAGHCIRLYTRHDFDGRPEHDVAEIRRMELAETVLQLRSAGITDLATFPFFERPPEPSLEAAELLLRRLQAVDSGGRVTPVGRRMLKLPLHPRLARLVAEGERRGVASEAALLAAALGERDVRAETRVQMSRAGGPTVDVLAGHSDLLEILDRLERAEAASFARDRMRALGLEPNAAQSVAKVSRQLQRALERTTPRPQGTDAFEAALGQAVLAAYPDRVAKRRRPKAPDILLFEGGAAVLAETSVVRDAEWMVAVDAEERGRGGIQVRVASAVEPEWLLDAPPGVLEESDGLEWNGEQGRVDRVTRLSYGPLVIEETRQPAPDSAEARALLVEKALSGGLRAFADGEAVQGLRVRLELLRGAYPEAGFPVLDDAYVKGALAGLAGDARSLSELGEGLLAGALVAGLDAPQQRLLSREVPDRLTLPGGRGVKVHYEPGKPPWIESRLQDFFGMLKTPRVCGGRVPLTLHLLAPNQRAVQVTTDLEGFWERHYPALRKELSRRYPRHSWPEDPKTAEPPAPKPPRQR